jgi:tetratricopeptide repeat protein
MEADMIRVVLHMGLIGAVAWASTPRGAWAQPAAAPDKRQVAKRYVAAGDAAQKAGDYDTAIEMYEKAYKLVPHPVLIFDIAQAQRLAGRLDEALRQYRQYVAVVPSGPEAETARDCIADIEAKLAAGAQPGHDTPGADGPRTAGPAPAAGDATGAVTPVSGTTPSASAGEHPGGAPPAGGTGGDASVAPASGRDAGTGDAAPGRTVRILGLAAGGVGVATLAVGIGYGVHAHTLSGNVSHQYDPDKDRAGVRANQIAIAGMVSGGVLLATGVVLYWWGHAQDRSSEHAVVMPVISDHGAGLAIIGAWP